MTSTSTAQPRARPGRRGPRTAPGKARAARNALKHGMRAAKYLVLPDEDAAEFAALETALIEELAPVGALQTLLARRVAIAAWRLARADRIEADLYRESGAAFPAECSETEYRRRLEAAYPIHPELFDRLNNDWGSLDRFQRTRGVLRLMAA
jgi:hypothetical protein